MIEAYKEGFRNLGEAIREYCGLKTAEDFDRIKIESLLSEEGFKKERDKKTLKELIIGILVKERNAPLWELEKDFKDKKLSQIVEEAKSKGVNVFVDALNYLHREDLMYVAGGKIYFTICGKQTLMDYGLLKDGELSTI